MSGNALLNSKNEYMSNFILGIKVQEGAVERILRERTEEFAERDEGNILKVRKVTCTANRWIKKQFSKTREWMRWL
jgi:hypothetical protein